MKLLLFHNYYFVIKDHISVFYKETVHHGLMETFVRIQMKKNHTYFLKNMLINQQNIWKRLKKNVLMDVMQTKIANMQKSFGFPV